MEKQIELKVVDGVVVTTSLNLADVIGVDHKDVLKSIRYLISINDCKKHFIQFTSETNKKKKRFYITKTGSSILVDVIDKVSNLKLMQQGLEMFDKMESNKK